MPPLVPGSSPAPPITLLHRCFPLRLAPYFTLTFSRRQATVGTCKPSAQRRPAARSLFVADPRALRAVPRRGQRHTDLALVQSGDGHLQRKRLFRASFGSRPPAQRVEHLMPGVPQRWVLDPYVNDLICHQAIMRDRQDEPRSSPPASQARPHSADSLSQDAGRTDHSFGRGPDSQRAPSAEPPRLLTPRSGDEIHATVLVGVEFPEAHIVAWVGSPAILPEDS